MKKSIIAATLVALTTGIFAGSAQAGTPWVDKREHRQVMRIWHGIANGQLTRWEANKLWHGQIKIRNADRRFGRDGYISPRERNRLRRMLDRQSRMIRRFKRN